MDGKTSSSAGVTPSAASVASPTQTRPGTSNSNKRKRSGVDFESSPGSVLDHDDEEKEEKKRTPGVKRACNECRQQKLRCDVVQDPFTVCSRCSRLKLECKIESNFKRIGKRSKHAEMEKQIERLERALQRAQAQGFRIDGIDTLVESPIPNGAYNNGTAIPHKPPSYIGSEEAVSSLLHLKQGGSYNMPRIAYELEHVGLNEETTNQLFNEFFVCYHPYLPFLNPSQPPERYHAQSPLLFWTIVTIASRRFAPDPTLFESLSGPFSRLLWSQIGEVSANHYVVKALCLLCTWPIPTSLSTSDPTHVLSGVMMKTATGIGLHRPSHIQDFSRVETELNQDQLHDRVTTWAVCNIVAQMCGTGYGQPASSIYDWTLAIRPGDDGPFALSPELEARLQIEKFCDKVSKEMYSNASDPRGVAGDELRALLTRVYRREFAELQANIMSQVNLSPIVRLHLQAAGLHLRLSAFFDSSSTKGYIEDLMGVWRAAAAFLDLVFELEDNSVVNMTGGYLRYATNYISQMVVAACFVLLKLLNSFFSKEIDAERGRQLFHRTIQAVRTISVSNNDLSWRLAELMVQMWNGGRVESRLKGGYSGEVDDSLQLKIRCRMSMSLVFDTIWKWREEYQAKGRGNIEAPESSASSSHLDSTLLPAAHVGANLQGPLQVPGSQPMTATGSIGAPTTPNPSNIGLPSNAYADTNYEVFDPLNWMLDGLVDFPYAFAPVQGLEASMT